ncbi:MAG TPA: hypothetical protein VFI32_04755 [Rhodanobacteraceae bacterium]|nr:hypothetical protein [Rhodanobacteraceae bacterium]
MIAALVGLIALLVSAYTANIQRQQVRAQVWTRLFFGASDVDRALMVTNKGVGPARIESLRFYVDGKAQRDWSHVLSAIGFTGGSDFEQSTVNGTVVAANERVLFLHFQRAEDWASFGDKGRGRIKLRACYCSVLDECLLFDERSIAPGRGAISAQVSPVDRCDRIEAEEFDN